ncbi:uncharacterized protein CC84DRAFT_1167644 [Paraphaeosphaeria sporulosa]|uniref:Uncharacterized protein n=1 Tax=Paraphaeosphaeria sporulosa TaxID=1460663 RepID=A0A177C1C6_9PLEO|nr:uncharacterized protein CC84DRAFT_1167644 [Paraphaeosphaeria sporulosa]OAG01443.1 hypothetical protein CC84DRAFT_1167644 [Paraphaeosphaeria sporulosa]
MHRPMEPSPLRHSKDFLSPHGSTRTLGSVTSRRSQRSASTRHYGSHLSTIPSRSNISVFSPPFSPPLNPALHTRPLRLSSLHVLPHHPYPHGHYHQHSHITVGTVHSVQHYPRGPFKSGCPACGVDPVVLFPRHPWDQKHRQPWWEHLKEEYDFVKPYIEWQRRDKYLRTQRRRKEGKLLRQRFKLRTLKKTWKVELKRFGWKLLGWKNWEPDKERSRQRPQQQQQQPPEPTFNLLVTGGEDSNATQDDRDIQGHEARQELLGESEARTDGERADTSDAGNCLRGLAGKHESKSTSKC